VCERFSTGLPGPGGAGPRWCDPTSGGAHSFVSHDSSGEDGERSHWSHPSHPSLDGSWDAGGDSGRGQHTFPDAFSWDFSVLALTEDECEHLVEQLLGQLGLLDDIGFDVPVLRRFIHACRKAHKPHAFTNWWRAVNACQAAAVFLHSTGAGALEKMALEDAAALMLSSARPLPLAPLPPSLPSTDPTSHPPHNSPGPVCGPPGCDQRLPGPHA
jgi:hypothetical protein